MNYVNGKSHPRITDWLESQVVQGPMLFLYDAHNVAYLLNIRRLRNFQSVTDSEIDVCTDTLDNLSYKCERRMLL